MVQPFREASLARNPYALRSDGLSRGDSPSVADAAPRRCCSCSSLAAASGRNGTPKPPSFGFSSRTPTGRRWSSQRWARALCSLDRPPPVGYLRLCHRPILRSYGQVCIVQVGLSAEERSSFFPSTGQLWNNRNSITTGPHGLGLPGPHALPTTRLRTLGCTALRRTAIPGCTAVQSSENATTECI